MSTRIFLWTWMFSLLLSTVGVSMHAVYCYCLGETTMQFLPVEHQCAVEQKVAVKACCTTTKPALRSCCQAGVEKSGCMTTTTKVFVMKTDLQVEKNILKAFDCQDIITSLSFDCFPVFSLIFPGLVRLNKAPPEPPPSLSGRDICLQHAVFRC
jgi:hypothetical protein